MVWELHIYYEKAHEGPGEFLDFLCSEEPLGQSLDSKVPAVTFHRKGGRDFMIYPLASELSLLEAGTRVTPKDTESRRACEKAFDFICCFSRRIFGP